MREEKLRKIIREELANFLIRTIEVEKASRPGEGEPKEGKIYEKVEVNVLEWFTSYLPYIEGAIRGMQHDMGRVNNKIWKDLSPAIESMQKIFLKHEKNMIEISKFTTKIKPLLEITYDESDIKKR